MRTIVAANTSLSRVALQELGDATRWVHIAELNKLYDPVITDPTVLLIPDPDQNAPKGVPYWNG